MDKKLDSIVESYLPKLIESVCESVRIPSVCTEDGSGLPYGREIDKAAKHAMACAESLGFRVTDLDGKICWAEYGEGEDIVAAMGHLDVVPPGDGWTFDPFSGALRDGKILGRGTQDDKGPLFSSLYALKALADLGVPLTKRVRVIFGMDEESGRMRDVAAYLASEPAPLYAYTPDGAYPVVNTEKGTIKFRSTVSFTQSGGAEAVLASVSGGEGLGSVPAKAQAVIKAGESGAEELAARLKAEASSRGWKTDVVHNGDTVTLKAAGRAAHATLPEIGINAVGRLFILLNTIRWSDGLGRFIRFMAEKFGVEHDGASLGIKASHPHCGRVTVNLALARGDSSSLTIVCGLYIPARTVEFDRVCEILKDGFTSAGADFEPTAQTKPLYYDESHPLIQTLMRGYRNATGEEPYPVSMCGGTYSKRMPNMVPFGAAFEGEDDRAHGTDEAVLISNMRESMRLMAYALWEMAK